MSVRVQTLSAGIASALLVAVASGVIVLGTPHSGFAIALTDSDLKEIKTILNDPSSALAADLKVLQTTDPIGVAAQSFKDALSGGTNTEAVASALSTLASADVALQQTIVQAVTDFASDSRLSAPLASTFTTNLSVASISAGTAFQATLGGLGPCSNAGGSGSDATSCTGGNMAMDARGTDIDPSNLNPSAPGPGGTPAAPTFATPFLSPFSGPGPGTNPTFNRGPATPTALPVNLPLNPTPGPRNSLR